MHGRLPTHAYFFFTFSAVSRFSKVLLSFPISNPLSLLYHIWQLYFICRLFNFYTFALFQMFDRNSVGIDYVSLL